MMEDPRWWEFQKIMAELDKLEFIERFIRDGVWTSQITDEGKKHLLKLREKV